MSARGQHDGAARALPSASDDQWRCPTIPPPWGLLTVGLLTLLPGDALYRLCFATTADATGGESMIGRGEALFARLFGGMLITGWWALVMAEAASFNAVTVIAGVVVLSGALYALAWRRGALHSTLARPQFTIPGLAAGVIFLLFGILTFSQPFETIVGAEDAGVYFNSAGLIAREGGIRLPDRGLAEFGDAGAAASTGGTARHLLLGLPDRGDPGNPRYLFLDWQRLQGFNLIQDDPNTVTPQFLHLFPTWLALWALLGGGVGAIVYGSAAFALVGLAATYLLARRLFGPAIALLVALLLALNGLQVWFARETLSENLLQPLLLGALWAWVLFIDLRDRPNCWPARGAALLAGMAIGSVALAHAQFVFALLPVAAALAWLWLARGWRPFYWWFFAPLIVLLGHATAHIARFALGYFEGIYHHVWKNAVRDWPKTTALVLAPALLVLLLGLPAVRAIWLPFVTAPRTQRFARWTGAGLALLLGCWLCLIRPGILPTSDPGRLSGYIGAPIPPGPGASFISLGWYLSPLGLALFFAGLALVILNDFDERIGALLCLAAPFSLLYLTGTYTAGGYIYTLRRFVPLILPLMTILIAYVLLRAGPYLARRFHHPGWRRPLQAGGLGIAALLIAFLVATNLRLVAHREYGGTLDQVRALADRFGPDDIILFSGPRDETQKVATPLRYLFGRETWVISTNLPDGALLDAWISQQEARGRTVHILMMAGGGKLYLPNHRLAPAGQIEIAFWQFETLALQKPYNWQRNALGYSQYELRPVPPDEAAIGTLPYRIVAGESDEFAQLGGSGTTPGFYTAETDQTPTGPLTYRWTDGNALLRIPWPANGQPLTLRLTLAAGPRPPSLPPAQVVVGLRPDPRFADQEKQLAVLTVGTEPADYTITIPADALPATASGAAVIHLGVPLIQDGSAYRLVPGIIWKPAAFPDATNHSTDGRDLHIRFIRAEVTAGR